MTFKPEGVLDPRRLRAVENCGQQRVPRTPSTLLAGFLRRIYARMYSKNLVSVRLHPGYYGLTEILLESAVDRLRNQRRSHRAPYMERGDQKGRF